MSNTEQMHLILALVNPFHLNLITWLLLLPIRVFIGQAALRMLGSYIHNRREQNQHAGAVPVFNGWSPTQIETHHHNVSVEHFYKIHEGIHY